MGAARHQLRSGTEHLDDAAQGLALPAAVAGTVGGSNQRLLNQFCLNYFRAHTGAPEWFRKGEQPSAPSN